MIAVDTNILVLAHRRDAALHPRAFDAVRSLAESPAPWGICYHSLVEFYGVVTRRGLWEPPSTPAQAVDQIRAWRESPGLRILCDEEGMIERLERMAVDAAVQGALVHDARIAACCLDRGVAEFWSIDRDFSRFPELRVRNPLSR